MPVGTVNGQVQDWDQISDSLGTLTASFQQNISNASPMIQNNASAFVGFTNTGVFSGGLAPIQNLTDNILQGKDNQLSTSC